MTLVVRMLIVFEFTATNCAYANIPLETHFYFMFCRLARVLLALLLPVWRY